MGIYSFRIAVSRGEAREWRVRSLKLTLFPQDKLMFLLKVINVPIYVGGHRSPIHALYTMTCFVSASDEHINETHRYLVVNPQLFEQLFQPGRVCWGSDGTNLRKWLEGALNCAKGFSISNVGVFPFRTLMRKQAKYSISKKFRTHLEKRMEISMPRKSVGLYIWM